MCYDHVLVIAFDTDIIAQSHVDDRTFVNVIEMWYPPAMKRGNGQSSI